MILFDWDDTLCPTTHLFQSGFRLETELTEEIRLELDQIEASVCRLLEHACQFGDVHIVTNGQTGWVELSAKKFLPKVVPILAKINVVSARSTFEGMFPGCPLKWKFYAFRENLSSSFAYSKLHRNVMSFGDSHYEREAIQTVTQGLPNTYTKSVKFTERPSLDQLRRQVDLIASCFDAIESHDGNLDLQLTVSFPEDGAANPDEVDAASAAAPATDASPNSATGAAADAMLASSAAAASHAAPVSAASKIAQQQQQAAAHRAALAL